MNEVKIGRKIAEARKNRNLTQQQLADALFVTNKTVSRWECGNNLPDTSILVALCEQLGISVGQLLEDEDSIGNAVANDVTASQEENAKELQEYSASLQKIRQKRTRNIIISVIAVVLVSVLAFWINSREGHYLGEDFYVADRSGVYKTLSGKRVQIIRDSENTEFIWSHDTTDTRIAFVYDGDNKYSFYIDDQFAFNAYMKPESDGLYDEEGLPLYFYGEMRNLSLDGALQDADEFTKKGYVYQLYRMQEQITEHRGSLGLTGLGVIMLLFSVYVFFNPDPFWRREYFGWRYKDAELSAEGIAEMRIFAVLTVIPARMLLFNNIH